MPSHDEKMTDRQVAEFRYRASTVCPCCRRPLTTLSELAREYGITTGHASDLYYGRRRHSQMQRDLDLRVRQEKVAEKLVLED